MAHSLWCLSLCWVLSFFLSPLSLRPLARWLNGVCIYMPHALHLPLAPIYDGCWRGPISRRAVTIVAFTHLAAVYIDIAGCYTVPVGPGYWLLRLTFIPQSTLHSQVLHLVPSVLRCWFTLWCPHLALHAHAPLSWHFGFPTVGQPCLFQCWTLHTLLVDLPFPRTCTFYFISLFTYICCWHLHICWLWRLLLSSLCMVYKFLTICLCACLRTFTFSFTYLYVCFDCGGPVGYLPQLLIGWMVTVLVTRDYFSPGGCPFVQGRLLLSSDYLPFDQWWYWDTATLRWLTHIWYGWTFSRFINFSLSPLFLIVAVTHTHCLYISLVTPSTVHIAGSGPTSLPSLCGTVVFDWPRTQFILLWLSSADLVGPLQHVGGPPHPTFAIYILICYLPI